ncbi:MAG: hypothetical protein M5U28_05805 [Sandaracinaceae bacterium]|nr:hypothetical protein [Sandaracinaceae bacterium]
MLQRSVTIRGVCAAETILTRAAPPAAMASEAQTVEIRGAEVVLRDLTIGRVPVAAVRVIGGSLDARGVVFEDYGFAGVRASGGAQVAVHDSSFRGGSSTGAGLLLQGVTTELRRVHMQRTRVVGIYAEGGTLDGEDVAIIGVPALTPSTASAFVSRPASRRGWLARPSRRPKAKASWRCSRTPSSMPSISSSGIRSACRTERPPRR